MGHIDDVRTCDTFDPIKPARRAASVHHANLRPTRAPANRSRPRDGCDLAVAL